MTEIPATPTTDAEVIAFALDHIEPFEVHDFLREWREGKDLEPWVEARKYALQDAGLIPTE